MGTIGTMVRALAFTGLAAGCAGDDLYAMFERFEIKDGGVREPAGGGCVLVVEGGRRGTAGIGGGTVDPRADFRISEQTRGDTLVVVVHSGSMELARRSYGEKFLSSGERDEFSVTTQAGRQFDLAYWGGPECDTSHLQAE
jgi:hypothetical protein